MKSIEQMTLAEIQGELSHLGYRDVYSLSKEVLGYAWELLRRCEEAEKKFQEIAKNAG